MGRCSRLGWRWLAALIAVLALSVPCGTALAQAPLRLVVSGPAGGAVDVAARQLAEQLRPQYTVVVENPAGAGGQIAVETVRKSAPDGNTLLVTPPGVFTIYPHIYPNLPYKTADFANRGDAVHV